MTCFSHWNGKNESIEIAELTIARIICKRDSNSSSARKKFLESRKLRKNTTPSEK